MQAKDIEKLQKMANAARFLSIDMTSRAKSGHPGLPMGTAELATALFARHLKFSAARPKWEERDRFVMSAGHGSALLYSLLWLTGYRDITLDDLKNFRQAGSKTAGHPEYGALAGIETTTGPLGQGISTAVGMAIAGKKKGSAAKVWALAGDGCLMEGISEEAISLAGTLGLDNLAVLWDNNNVVIDGRAEDASKTDQTARFRANGWATFEVRDGYDFEELDAAMAAVRKAGRPAFAAVKTTIGKGHPGLAGTAKVHGSPLSEEQALEARRETGWNYAPFEIPDDVLADWRSVGAKYDGEASEPKPLAPPDLRDAFGALKKKFIESGYGKATRAASGEVLAAIAPLCPHMVGGTADLAEPTFTKTLESKTIAAGDFSGNFIEYGIREHAMAAVMNGLMLSGFKPYGGTFLTFMDYMKPALRLSALMRLGVVYVLTHDSIFLGEDGPTHQPIEQLASLRALPNFNLMRPADAVEVAEAWEVAIASTETPCGIACSRQALPLLRREAGENMLAKGAYEISPAADGVRHLSLIATGSEVAVAIEAQKILREKHGMNAAVVSMPSWFLFERQSDEYRAGVIPEDTICVSIEAGSTLGWERYADIRIGIDEFGESGKAEDLRARFGFTPEKIVEKITAEL